VTLFGFHVTLFALDVTLRVTVHVTPPCYMPDCALPARIGNP
jgi:hypothetical protein